MHQSENLWAASRWEGGENGGAAAGAGGPAYREGLAAPGTTNPDLSRTSHLGASGPHSAVLGLEAAGSTWNPIRAFLVGVGLLSWITVHGKDEHGLLSPAGNS